MYMAYWLKENAPRHYNLKFIFANTGEEREETLRFVNQCDMQWKLGVVWLEAKVLGARKGTSYTVTDYAGASRNGEPFEAVIQKYGIPNAAYPHCTRELKLAPITSYMSDNGLKDAWTAIGIRVDEIDRMRGDAAQARLIYPFIQWTTVRKQEVKEFWESQPFELGLKEHEGNCKWCWKKSDRKLYTLALDNPDIFDFPKRMENEYGLAGANVDGTHRRFFRHHRSAADILAEAGKANFEKFSERNFTHEPELDLGFGCGDTCEAFVEAS